MAQQQITVTTTNGQPAVTINGTPADWVTIVYVSVEPNGTPILYLGCTHFSANFTAGLPAPTPTPAP